MQIGFNNDVEFEGVRYHIQTEDHGLKDGRITSQIFLSGAIIDTVTISYTQAIESIESPEERDAEIRRRMRTLHKHCYKNIVSHKYGDENDVPDELSASTPPQDDTVGEHCQPPQPVETVTADDDAPTLTMQALSGAVAMAQVVPEEPHSEAAQVPSESEPEPVAPSRDTIEEAAVETFVQEEPEMPEPEDEGDTQPEPTTPPPALPFAGVLRSVGNNKRAARVVYNNHVSAFRGFDAPAEQELAQMLAPWATPSS